MSYNITSTGAREIPVEYLSGDVARVDEIYVVMDAYIERSL